MKKVIMKKVIMKKLSFCGLALSMIIFMFSVIIAPKVKASDGTCEDHGEYITEQLEISTYRNEQNKNADGNYTAVPVSQSGSDWVFAGWYTDTTCTTTLAKNKTSGTYTAKFVPAHVLDVKTQISDNVLNDNDSDDTTASLRFVTSVDSLKYSKVGFFVLFEGETEPAISASNRVYKKLYAVGSTESVMSYEPTVLCSVSKYFKACTITGIPTASFGEQIKATPFWITKDGTLVKGEAVSRSVNEAKNVIKKVAVTYPDNTTETIYAVSGQGLAKEPTVGYNNPFLKTYLNGEEASDLKEACKTLTADATVTYTYTSKTTNKTAGTGIAMAANGTVTLTGPTGITGKDDQLLSTETLWGKNSKRRIETVEKSEYSVLEVDVQFVSDHFNEMMAGIAVDVNGEMGIVGIRDSQQKVFCYADSAGNINTEYTKSGTGTERLAFVSNGSEHYFFVNDTLIYTIKDGDKWSSGKAIEIGTVKGFAIRGVGEATFSNYSYAIGETAVNKYLAENLDVKVTITYPDKTTETIQAIYSEGLEKEPTVGYNNPFLKAYVNGVEVADLKEACKTLTADATVTYKYISKTTNKTAGTGIAMAADGTVTLTGPTGITGTADVLLGTENLYAKNSKRQIETVEKNEYSVLAVDVKFISDHYNEMMAGIAVDVNGEMGIVGVRDTQQKVFAYSDIPGNVNTGYTKSGTGTEHLVFVSNGSTYYLFVNDKLILTINDGDKWSENKAIEIGDTRGFAIRGTGEATFSNYSYAIGETAVNKYLAENLDVKVTITYPDKTTETIQAIYSEGLEKEPTVGYNNPFLKAYVNGNEVADLKEACKTLTADAAVTYTYTSKTTNKTAGTGIAMAADGTVTLTGPTGITGKDDLLLSTETLWGKNSKRRIETVEKSEYSVLEVDVQFVSDHFNEMMVGIAVDVNEEMGIVGIRDSQQKVFCYADSAGNINTEYTKSGTGTERLAFVSNGSEHYFFVNDTLIYTIKDGDKWSSGTAIEIGTVKGFAIRGVGEATFSNYSYKTGEDVVAAYLNQAVSVTYPDGTQETIMAMRGVGLEKEPTVGYNNPFLKTYLNGEEVDDLKTKCRSLTADAEVTYKYTSKTTNKTAGTGIAMAADGTVTLTGPTGITGTDDLLLSTETLWGKNSKRRIETVEKSDYSVLAVDVQFVSDHFNEMMVGIAVDVNGEMGIVGVRDSQQKVFCYADSAGNVNQAYTKSGTGIERLVFVTNGDTCHLFVNGELILTIKDGDKWSNNNVIEIGDTRGFAIRGVGEATFSNYSYETGEEAVNEYLADKFGVEETQQTVYLSATNSENLPGYGTELKPYATLDYAMRKVVQGGKIVLKGNFSVPSNFV